MGMSLGGYTTALWASIAGPDDVGGVDFAVAMIPAVSLARLMWRHGEDSPQRRRAIKAGITEDLLVDAFAVHAPLTRAPRVPRERLFVIAGRGDRITPPEQAEALAAHWGATSCGSTAATSRRSAAATRCARCAARSARLGMPGRSFRG